MMNGNTVTLDSHGRSKGYFMFVRHLAGQIIMKYLNVFFKTRSSFRTKLILYESYRYWLFETPRSPTRLNRLRLVVARSLLKFSFDDASRKPRSSTWYGFMRIHIDITAFSHRLRKIQIISSLTLKSSQIYNCSFIPFHHSCNVPNSNSKFRAVDKLGAVEELLRFDAYAFISNNWPHFVFSYWSSGLYILSTCRWSLQSK